MSSDWFREYWHTIEVYVDRDKKDCVQRGCRSIVGQFMAATSRYWDISFSLERVRRSFSELDGLLKQCGLAKAALESIHHLVSGEEEPIDEGTRWLLVSLTEQLLDGSITGQSP